MSGMDSENSYNWPSSLKNATWAVDLNHVTWPMKCKHWHNILKNTPYITGADQSTWMSYQIKKINSTHSVNISTSIALSPILCHQQHQTHARKGAVYHPYEFDLISAGFYLFYVRLYSLPGTWELSYAPNFVCPHINIQFINCKKKTVNPSLSNLP